MNLLCIQKHFVPPLLWFASPMSGSLDLRQWLLCNSRKTEKFLSLQTKCLFLLCVKHKPFLAETKSSIWDNLNRPLVRMKSTKLSSMITWRKQGIYKSLQYTSILSVLSICPIYPIVPTGLSHLFVRSFIPSVCLPCPSRLSVRPSVHLIWPSVEHF